MGKRILRVYLAKNDAPYSAAYAKLDLPASPWELWDAMEKVRLQTDDILYMEIEDYFAFEYLSPHLDGLDISLNELNALAAQLAALDEVQGIAFEGMFSIAVQRKVNANGGIITLRDLRDLAVSAKTDCYHVVDAADDTQLGRFYAENEFVPELDGISDEVFEMLDFAGIGRMMRCSENGVFVGSLYVLQDGELTTAPPVQKTLPEKPGYLAKPFHLAELEARIRSLTLRQFTQQDVLLSCGDLSFDTRSRTAAVSGQALTLTRKEAGILEYLMVHQGRPVSQEELIDHVWDNSVDSFSNSIRVHISALRKKLRTALGYDPIRNRIGEGYLMGGEEA